jgi:hypothetical protein
VYAALSYRSWEVLQSNYLECKADLKLLVYEALSY